MAKMKVVSWVDEMDGMKIAELVVLMVYGMVVKLAVEMDKSLVEL